jgi:integrase
MRPGEVCRIRPRDADTSVPVWVYRAPVHKTAHHGQERSIPLGVKAHAVLAEFSPTEPDGYYFNPKHVVDELRADRSAKRLTPRYPSHMKRNAVKRKANPRRIPAAFYSRHAYTVAVIRAVKLANRDRITAGVEVAEHLPAWTPNQLRHTFASEVRRQFGLEAAQVLLGHARADTTQIYTERDASLAIRVTICKSSGAMNTSARTPDSSKASSTVP